MSNASLLSSKYPIIMAPMFLVTNEEMMVAAYEAGISPCIPAHNYRTVTDLSEGLTRLVAKTNGSFGVNLIVNKSNPTYQKQLAELLNHKIEYIITSLGSPKEVLDKAHKKGIKVFCDVTDVFYAKKVEALGADAVIAVNNEAGGHAGNISGDELVKQLKAEVSIPVISAGGVGDSQGVKLKLDLGAKALSIGTVFIASNECGVTEDYKQACVTYKAEDIVMTTKLSGTPCTVINTPYVREVGTKQTWLEKLLNNNKRLKKWVKALLFYRGMKSLEKAAFSTTYKSVWCAGPSIRYVDEVKPIAAIVESLTKELDV